MDSFNKVISFVLGLVVVLVFFAVVTGKLNLGKFTPSFSKKNTLTPTPTPVSTVKITDNSQVNGADSGESPLGNNYKKQEGVSSPSPKSIPATGIPTLFIPSLLAGGLGGAFLRKTGKK